MHKHFARELPIVSLAALLLISPTAGGDEVSDGSAALSTREIAGRASGAVVLIEAETEGGTSQGSGFFIDETTLVTCLHVIDGAHRVTVSLRDGTQLEEVAVRAFDIESDLAVLVVAPSAGDPERLTVDLGDTSLVEPGSEILVIGNPMGLEHTVTEGIVSAWRQPKDLKDEALRTNQNSSPASPPGRLLQISASISPGSSGGPVLNERAEVIGVATSGVLWGMASLNFAVPVDELPALLAADDTMDLETFAEEVEDMRREMARPYLVEGTAAYQRGDVREAIPLLERVLQLVPRHEEALVLTGKIAIDAGQLELAEQRLKLATEVDDYNAEAWYLLGTAQRLRALAGDDVVAMASAETAFEKALAIDARHGGASYQLALIQLGKGAYDRAERLLQSAVDNEPGFVDAIYMLGEVHLQHGRMNKAREAFEKVLWEDEGHARSHFGLARLYMETERTPHGAIWPHGRAAEHWKEFLRLSEDDPSLDELRKIALFYVKQHFPFLLD